MCFENRQLFSFAKYILANIYIRACYIKYLLSILLKNYNRKIDYKQ